MARGRWAWCVGLVAACAYAPPHEGKAERDDDESGRSEQELIVGRADWAPLATFLDDPLHRPGAYATSLGCESFVPTITLPFSGKRTPVVSVFRWLTPNRAVTALRVATSGPDHALTSLELGCRTVL